MKLPYHGEMCVLLFFKTHISDSPSTGWNRVFVTSRISLYTHTRFVILGLTFTLGFKRISLSWAFSPPAPAFMALLARGKHATLTHSLTHSSLRDREQKTHGYGTVVKQPTVRVDDAIRANVLFECELPG